MSDMTSSMPPAAGDTREAIAEQTRQQREPYLKNANGDIVGNNYTVPKGDFGAFLGYKQPQPQEQDGNKPLSGGRVIELALQKEMSQLGQGAAEHGNSYRNIAISWGRFNNEPGRERDMVKDALDAIKQGPEKNNMESLNARGTDAQRADAQRMSPAVQPYVDQFAKIQSQSHNDNVKYLEMQYKFQEMSKQEGTISNLMKTRHDAITRTIRGSQG